MENTVIGVYDSYAQAENARNELLSSGFAESDVHLNPEGGASEGARDEHSGSAIGNFFRSLFGREGEPGQNDMYSEAVRRGSCVLAVDAQSEEQRERAVEVMNRHDPVDIDERAAHWRSQGWSGYEESVPRLTDAEIESDRQLTTQGRDMSLSESAGMTYGGVGSSAAGVSGLSAADAANASHVDMTRTQMATDNVSDTSRMAGTTAGSDTIRTEGQQAIPVVEEQLHVGKREVQRGGVRVLRRVSEKPVHETVSLREEHVTVERHPVDQPADQADLTAAFQEGEIELRETAEEAVVSKTARVVEEVVVGKEVTQRTEDICDTVRRTDVEVEQLSPSNTGSRMTGDDDDFRTHWQTNFGQSGGRYEDYDAAYRYGSTLAGSDRMKNYRWQDVEPQARSDWESSHPESTWDQVKDAVRYGAERVSGRGRGSSRQ